MFSKSAVLKTTLFSAALSLGLSSPAHALVSFGIKGGMSLAKTASDSAISAATFGTGYAAGFSLDVGMAPISFLIDALYTQRKFTLPTSGYSYDVIHIPVQAKLHLMPLLFVSGGGYYDMVIGSTVKNYNSSGTYTGTSAFSSNTQKFDYGAVLGLGASLPLGVSSLTIEARYNYGLVNLVKNPSAGEYNKNRYADLLIGFTF